VDNIEEELTSSWGCTPKDKTSSPHPLIDSTPLSRIERGVRGEGIFSIEYS